MAEEDRYESTVEVTVSRDMGGVTRLASVQKAVLVVISGPRLGHRAVLEERALEIGRGSACGFVLDADSVSRRHARVEWTGSRHRLVDLNSTNGTYVNEARTSERLLEDGDRIQIGKALLKYVAGGNIEGAYHEEVQRLMRFDGLTGVYNKTHFEESLRLEVFATRAQPKVMSLIVFDLDHFKSINDRYGHTAGDAVLCQVAEVVGGTLAGEQLLGRVGGEEFAVLWSGGRSPETRGLAERIRGAVERQHFSFDGIHIPVTVSLGVAERSAGSEEPAEELYRRADSLLYQAKAAGRNCVR